MQICKFFLLLQKSKIAMNFLAHIYLSGNNDLMKIGNFMADGIRGNEHLDMNIEIKKGVILHRHIDTFTDSHPIYRQSKHRLHEKYGHYAGVIMDILYDHFLAKNWHKYSDESLEGFADNFYKSLEANYNLLTIRTKNLLPYMTEQNWLVSYSTIAGIEKILFQMDYRTKHRANMQEAVVELQQFYEEFEDEFAEFFEELRSFCKTFLK
jgi:acyl carrier protein phosphodiesterase